MRAQTLMIQGSGSSNIAHKHAVHQSTSLLKLKHQGAKASNERMQAANSCHAASAYPSRLRSKGRLAPAGSSLNPVLRALRRQKPATCAQLEGGMGIKFIQVCCCATVPWSPLGEH